MQQLLPNPYVISTIENKALFFYFFRLKNLDDNGAGIQHKFATVQATCLHWLQCEYAIIGEESDFWTHAAIFEFPNFTAVKQAIQKGINDRDVEALQALAIEPTKVPGVILFLFILLRPFSILINRYAEKVTLNQVIERMNGEGGIHPNINQTTRHFQNNRTSKAYMINLLQYYSKAQYGDRSSSISGATAYRRYGFVGLRSIMMLGGNLILTGSIGQPILEVKAPITTIGDWEEISIMECPNPAQLFTLKKCLVIKNHYRIEQQA